MKTIKVIVAGGRNFNDASKAKVILATMMEEVNIEIVSGMAKGADMLGYDFAKDNNLTCHEFPANWDDVTVPGAVIRSRNGRDYNVIAGHMRNKAMAAFADLLVAFWDGKSTGTKHMIETMKSLGKPVFIIYY